MAFRLRTLCPLKNIVSHLLRNLGPVAFTLLDLGFFTGIMSGLPVFGDPEPQVSSRELWGGELAGLWMSGSPALALNGATVWWGRWTGVHLQREEISSVLHVFLRTYYASGTVPGAGSARMTKTVSALR